MTAVIDPVAVVTDELVIDGPGTLPVYGVIVNVYAVVDVRPVYLNPDAVAVFEDPSEQLIVYDVEPSPPVQLMVTPIAVIFVKLIPETEFGRVVIGPTVVEGPYAVPV